VSPRSFLSACLRRQLLSGGSIHFPRCPPIIHRLQDV
jgi:hypothetical protein